MIERVCTSLRDGVHRKEEPGLNPRDESRYSCRTLRVAPVELILEPYL